ncbi:MAG TPA: substrate-binding domain-containing protein [Burkholderiales bacterium]|nr:substrate-binding domain-containing protein [Burkholderiales bacterium]
MERILKALTLGLLWLSLAGTTYAAKDIRLATTTSTENSGLLKFLLPKFEAQYGAKVRVIAVGTGNALKLGENGDVDVVMVHARPSEDKFVAAGYGVNRRDIMYNDFIIVGPANDPAKIAGTKDAVAAFKKIAETRSEFISRGDDSGTNKKEKIFWEEAGITPKGDWYISAGQGMGAVLTMAGERQAYTLTDRATYSTFRAKTGLTALVEGDPKLFNPYGVIAVNPKRYPDVNYLGAMAFIAWLTSPEGQKEIGSYTLNGLQLFHPDANSQPDKECQ